jgi:hypothetical protein
VICSYAENFICTDFDSNTGMKMGRLNVAIEDEVESKFREAVFKRKGMKKGNLTKSLEEAMLMWVSAPENGRKIHKE